MGDIYNIFQISVSNDIRFLGLLKTIGATGRQLKRMVIIQALFLSAIGIPIGSLIGYGIGACLKRTAEREREITVRSVFLLFRPKFAHAI